MVSCPTTLTGSRFDGNGAFCFSFPRAFLKYDKSGRIISGMWPGIFRSVLVGVAITIGPLALFAITSLAFWLIFTVGMPFSLFSEWVYWIFSELGVDRAWVINTQIILAGVASSLFYGAVVYFVPFLKPLRSPKRYATLLTLSMILVIAVSGMLIAFSPGPGVVIENATAGFVLAALDLQSCELLAINEFDPPTAENRAAYDEAVRTGNIVLVKNGTEAKQQGKVLNYKNRHLVAWKSTGPITYAEQVSQHTAVYQWVLLKEGLHVGRTVCLSSSMVRGKYPLS